VRRLVWIVTLAVLFGAVSWNAQAAIPTFTHLYVFGDSYCDVGNVFIATGGTEPAPPYYNGRFSNGPIWVDHVAGFLGLGALKPYLAGGTDFAFGGAEVLAPVTTPQGTIPSVPQQVALYLQSVGGKADPNALYIIEGGGNDILKATPDSPQQLGFEIALGISKSELLLRRAGARHFLIPNLFNVGLLPAATGNSAFATAASNATNQSLSEMLVLEGLIEGVHIVRLDVFSLESAIVNDPSHFGFTNITTPCFTLIPAPSLCADSLQTFFWDVEHPTLFGHAFFAVTVENTFATLEW
jgi:phospholipase/lecithinase/hemolysin